MEKNETPQQTYQRVYNEIKYGVEVNINGCRSEGFTCTIVSAMDSKAVDKTVELIAKIVINETLSEYTNDDNHDRVEHWNEVLNIAIKEQS